jgi:hypothetical protein
LEKTVVQAEIAALATRLVVPGIKYSWINACDPEATTTVELLDRIISQAFNGALTIRLDEMIRADWERWAGAEWWRVDDPCTSLLTWLNDSHLDARHFNVMRTPSKGRE